MKKKPRYLQMENALLLLESLTWKECRRLAKRYREASYMVSASLHNALSANESDENEKLNAKERKSR